MFSWIFFAVKEGDCWEEPEEVCTTVHDKEIL